MVLASTQFKHGGWEKLGPTRIYKVFLTSSHDRSSLHKGFFYRSFRSHVAQTWWMGELRMMKLLFGKFLWKEFLDEFSFPSFFFFFFFFRCWGEARVVDSSYLGEFLCFPEVLEIATKFRFCESQVSAKTKVIAKAGWSSSRPTHIITTAQKEFAIAISPSFWFFSQGG